jgi:hypothetical protein
MKLHVTPLVFILFGQLSPSAFSQTSTIRGTVVDKISLEPLPSANILILGTKLGASSDIDGKFVIQDVPFDIYQIRVSLVGYESLILSDIVVAAGKETNLMVRLDQVPIGIGTVEVTAQYFQKSPDAPVSVQRLSTEEIRRSPGGFEDVLRAISVLPGVAQAEPGRNDLVIRGGAPSENLYVVDNVEVPNINHFGTQGAAGGPLSYINLDFIRETAFSTGGFGAKYGDKMSSVLTFDLRDGRTDRMGGKATIAATQFGLNLEGPISEDATFIFSARRSYLDFIFKASGFGFVPEYWDVLGRVQYRLDNKNRISFMAVGALDDVTFFNDTPDQRYDNSRVLGTAQKQYASGVSWERLFGTGFITTTLGRSYVTYNGVQNDSLLRPIFQNQSKETETSLRADGVFKSSLQGKNEISFGIQIKRVNFETDLALPGFGTSFGDTLGVAVQDFAETGTKGSAYLQALHHFPLGFQFVVGGRLDFFDRIERKFYVSPRASLTWEASPLTSVSFAAGMYRQFPSYVWFVADARNRSMSAARVDQYILGVEHLLRADLKVRFEGFYKDYRDYPASVTRPYLVMSNTGGGFGGSEDNFASFGLDYLVSEGWGNSYGVDFLVQKKLSEIPLYGIFSLTLSRARFVPLDGVERAGRYDQRVLLNLSAGYKFDERWEASTRFRYGTGRPYTPFNNDGTQDVSRLYSERLKPYHALDVRVDRRWNFSRWNLIVYVDIQNIYNLKYASSPRWDPRTGAAVQDESSIGILPSIGVSAEF